jgi:hypothetical protein
VLTKTQVKLVPEITRGSGAYAEYCPHMNRVDNSKTILHKQRQIRSGDDVSKPGETIRNERPSTEGCVLASGVSGYIGSVTW